MPRTIVVVEDDASLRSMLAEELRRHDFEVVDEGSSGRDAVALCATYRPEAVVVDRLLRDMTGRDVIASIRHSSPHTRVVMFSRSFTPLDDDDGDPDVFVSTPAGSAAVAAVIAHAAEEIEWPEQD